jgi:SAM-dependent methyltransferase
MSELTPLEDAYGQIYLALLEGRQAEEIMERDDGLIYSGDPSDYFDPFPRWPRVEQLAMEHVRGRVLDVGCGGGRVSLHLQEIGCDVVAIDESPLAVEVARRRGVRQASVCSLAEVDTSLGQFDTILLLRNNVGLAGAPDQTHPLLERLARIATANARLITDSVDPQRIDDPVFRTYPIGDPTEPRPLAQRYRVRWRQFATPWFAYVMTDPATFAGLIHGSGWQVTRLLDDGSPRYAVVLERAAAAAE